MKKNEAKEVYVKGSQLECPVCKGTRFWERSTLLNTPGFTFLNFDWLNKSAKNQICENCNYIFWFFED